MDKLLETVNRALFFSQEWSRGLLYDLMPFFILAGVGVAVWGILLFVSDWDGTVGKNTGSKRKNEN